MVRVLITISFNKAGSKKERNALFLLLSLLLSNFPVTALFFLCQLADEFYFAMMSTKTRKGQIIADRGNKALSQDTVRLLKTQDARYLRTMAQVEGNKRRRLEAAFVLLFGPTAEDANSSAWTHRSAADDQNRSATR